ncbi:hypothetical protein RSOLAG22IIIB_13653 [Rhizoctonia solani]|uniref:Uncharacterized protein n=1 Tax=Rhizoctonia solani TaxID=456999 RepID=A0A0K6FQ55_9AGAM|nr:hypothetical protein RSOLAG22IIIB_13653 [Rhizoctonia solani]
MFKLTRAFVVAAAVSSSVMCAPVPQDVGRPISAGQSASPLASASSVFGTSPQDPNYQSCPTGLCMVPALAKNAGLSQGQEQLTVQQAIQLCPEASTIAVSSKSLKQSQKDLNPVSPVPLPAPESHPDAPHPARSVDEHPPNTEMPPKPTNGPVAGAPQPYSARDVPPQKAHEPQPTPKPVPDGHEPHAACDTPPHPEAAPSPSPVPQPHTPHPARSNGEQPPKVEAPPQASPKPQAGAPQPHVARDVPPQPSPEPQPSPLPQPDGRHPVGVRSEDKPHPDAQSAPQPSPQPNPQTGEVPCPVGARSEPKGEAPGHGQPLPASMPRPSQLV